MLSESHGECKPYGRPRSLTCDMITPANAASSSNGTRVRLNGNTGCIKINVVLLISHGMCGKQYGEETKGQLSVRMYGHRDDWSQKIWKHSSGKFLLARTWLHEACLCLLFGHQQGWTDTTRKSERATVYAVLTSWIRAASDEISPRSLQLTSCPCFR